ncbi:hypothetical protein C8R47DRAFT_1213988 [Mycena vitilis]|nr:hypothetical protein C8R47DRAFT_1213988 [Mycena vitilis]
MADDSAQSTPTSNTAASSETSEAEAELDREIIRLFLRERRGFEPSEVSRPSQPTPKRGRPSHLRHVRNPRIYRGAGYADVSTLSSLPVHFATEWTGTCWERTPLRRLGFVFQLGHRGLACPSAEAEEKRMTVIAANGIHIVKFRYCNCPGHPEGVAQLVNVGWFPGRDEVKCVTFEMLGICTALGVIP